MKEKGPWSETSKKKSLIERLREKGRAKGEAVEAAKAFPDVTADMADGVTLAFDRWKSKEELETAKAHPEEFRKRVMGEFPRGKEVPVNPLAGAISSILKETLGDSGMTRLGGDAVARIMNCIESWRPDYREGGKWEDVGKPREITFFVIAGDHRQAQRWASIRGIPAAHWRFVDGPDKLRGMGPNPVVFVGTYWEQDDIDLITREMMQQAISRRE